jgi:hypothetical protein
VTDKLISIEVVSKAFGIDMNSALAEFSALRARLFVSAEDYSALALKRVEDLSKPVAVKAPVESGKVRTELERPGAPAGAEVISFSLLAREMNLTRSQLAKRTRARGVKLYYRQMPKKNGVCVLQRCVLVSDVLQVKAVPPALPQGSAWLLDLAKKLGRSNSLLHRHCRAHGYQVQQCSRPGSRTAVACISDEDAAKIANYYTNKSN